MTELVQYNIVPRKISCIQHPTQFPRAQLAPLLINVLKLTWAVALTWNGVFKKTVKTHHVTPQAVGNLAPLLWLPPKCRWFTYPQFVLTKLQFKQSIWGPAMSPSMALIAEKLQIKQLKSKRCKNFQSCHINIRTAILPSTAKYLDH